MAFAYDHQNYARYLIPFIDGMCNLPNLMPDVHKAFMNDEFAVQMYNTNTFGRNEADKTIKNTINRDCKTKGGLRDSAQMFRRPKGGFSMPHEEVLTRRCLQNS